MATYRVNHQITSPNLRVLRADGSQIDIMTNQQALEMAHAENLDLVEIAPFADPPVVKLINYKKFLYQEAKKSQAAKASAKKVDLKEIRLTPFMAQNDFDVKMARAKSWLAEGHKVRVTVKFVGRQLTHKEFGAQIFDRTITVLNDIAAVDQPPKWIGKQYIGTLTPAKKK